MSKIPSGATVNGVKPIGANVVHEYGHKGSARPSTPKASQIAAAGASDPGTGRHIAKPGESKPDLAGPNAGVQTTGTTAEEQKKKLAGRMYPSSRGLRQYGAGG